jgi:hypothetical protein
MKNVIALLLVLFSVLASLPAGAERPAGSTPPGDAAIATLDTSSTNLPATYGASANQFSSAGVGHNNLCVVNGAATKIYGTTSMTATCTAASDKFIVPASGAACWNYIKLNKYICLRSSSGTLSSGVIDLQFW